jgi:hypothetical protein
MKIEGFTPTRDKHEALIYFEPYSGTPVRAHHRIQMNVDAITDSMRQSEYGSNLEPTKRKGVRRLLPLVWIDQEVNVDAPTIRTLRMIHLALRYGIWVIYDSSYSISYYHYCYYRSHCEKSSFKEKN